MTSSDLWYVWCSKWQCGELKINYYSILFLLLSIFYFILFYFLTPMDYSPWFEGKVWPFWRQTKKISPKLERQHPPKLVCMHFTSIPTCIFHPILFELIFSLPWMVQNGNLAKFKSSNIFETREAMPTKFGVHAFDINPYLHKFLSQFQSIEFFDNHGL